STATTKPAIAASRTRISHTALGPAGDVHNGAAAESGVFDLVDRASGDHVPAAYFDRRKPPRLDRAVHGHVAGPEHLGSLGHGVEPGPAPRAALNALIPVQHWPPPPTPNNS